MLFLSRYVLSRLLVMLDLWQPPVTMGTSLRASPGQLF